MRAKKTRTREHFVQPEREHFTPSTKREHARRRTYRHTDTYLLFYITQSEVVVVCYIHHIHRKSCRTCCRCTYPYTRTRTCHHSDRPHNPGRSTRRYDRTVWLHRRRCSSGRIPSQRMCPHTRRYKCRYWTGISGNRRSPLDTWRCTESCTWGPSIPACISARHSTRALCCMRSHCWSSRRSLGCSSGHTGFRRNRSCMCCIGRCLCCTCHSSQTDTRSCIRCHSNRSDRRCTCRCSGHTYLENIYRRPAYIVHRKILEMDWTIIIKSVDLRSHMLIHTN